MHEPAVALHWAHSHVAVSPCNTANCGSAGQSVGENGGKEGVSSSTAERRELRLANRRSARFSSLADA